MVFPPLSHLGKALLIALVLALIGFLVTPAAGWTASPAVQSALLLALGALLGGWLSAVQRNPASESDTGELLTVFVGNLAFKATEEEVRDLFASFGTVRTTRIMRDRKTRRPRGYGFVEMPRAAATGRSARSMAKSSTAASSG